MSKIEDTAKNVIDKLLNVGFEVNIVKKLLSVLLFCMLLFCFGCGGSSDNPKDVVASFISACKRGNYKKASKMCYDPTRGTIGFRESAQEGSKIIAGERFEKRIDLEWYGQGISGSPWMKVEMEVKEIRISPETGKYSDAGRDCHVEVFVKEKVVNILKAPKEMPPELINRVRSYEGEYLDQFYLTKLDSGWVIISTPSFALYNRNASEKLNLRLPRKPYPYPLLID